MAKRFTLAGDQTNKERRRTRTRIGITSERSGLDIDYKTYIQRKTGRKPTRHTRREEPFPWSRLPPELRVKILRNLRRIDLDNCRLLNRETFRLIRHNEKSMKRTIIDSLEIPEQHYLRVRSFDLVNLPRFKDELITWPIYRPPREVRVIYTNKILCYLPVILKNAEIHQVTIEEWHLKEEILKLFSSCVRNADCEVHKLTIADVSTDGLTSSMFLQFLCDVAPREIILRHIVQYFHETITVEILRFIVSRQRFCVEDFESSWSLRGVIRIDDDILAQVTAVDFKIDAPNLITIDGLKSFFRGLGSRKHDVHGIIYTNFDIHGMTSSEFTNVTFRIGKNLRSIEFWFRTGTHPFK